MTLLKRKELMVESDHVYSALTYLSLMNEPLACSNSMEMPSFRSNVPVSPCLFSISWTRLLVYSIQNIKEMSACRSRLSGTPSASISSAKRCSIQQSFFYRFTLELLDIASM